MKQDLPLAAEFPPADEAQWRTLVERVLKGASFDRKLVGRTYDGLRIAPLYRGRQDAQPIAGRAPAKPWQIMQRIEHPDAGMANAEALQELANGANGLSLVFSGAAGAHGFGLDGSEAALARALDGVYLEAGIAIELDLSPQTKLAPDHLAALVAQRGLDPAETDIRFGLNPLGAMARLGGTEMPWPELAPHFAKRIARLADRGFRGPFVVADGRIVHDAGGSEAQELAFTLASAVAYLRALETQGIALDAARRMIAFRLSADADQFLTIAKFRALRMLWARVEDACGLLPRPAFIAAETAWRMMTRRDPYVNMLRVTIAAFAAGVGGADAITVLPFTAARGLPDRFARRVARNTQLILLEEANLAKVSDPAAGAGAFEDLTGQLCAAAWALFQEIEKAGGAYAALETGLIQKQVAATRAERARAVATRREPLTGTSDYPNLDERYGSTLDVAPVRPPAFKTAIAFEAMPAERLAEPFEVLRDRSDAMLAKTGARPRIFLANLGTAADFTARATFAKNFFEAGGIETIGNDGFTSPNDMAAAFHQSGATLACLCSSDAIYAQEALPAAEALKKAGARLWLAGRPGEREADDRRAGIEGFIFVGCDVLAALQSVHDMMGAERLPR
ncbi:MAG: methylmalonyl-CoA mutase family protein [Pseudorhodoplanes sp.]